MSSSQKLNMDLNGDGLIENLYHYLWSKDSLFNRSPQVNIPDTVIFRYEQPVFWYFTSKPKSEVNPDNTASTGDLNQTSNTAQVTKIMRKSRKNLNNKEIERAFLKEPSPSGIVAVYMYRKTERNIVNVMKRQERQGSLED